MTRSIRAVGGGISQVIRNTVPPRSTTSSKTIRTRLIVDIIPRRKAMGRKRRKACFRPGSPLYIGCTGQIQRSVKQEGDQSLVSDAPRQVPEGEAEARPSSFDRTIVLIGMMGAGKTAVGRRLAAALGWPFADADHEIEAAAGTTIPNIFAEIGEAAFRQSERQVIARLLQGERKVLALGGGAFVNPQTRALVRERGISVWLRADLDVLARRTARRNDRPLLHTADPKARLAELLEARAPIYAEADLIVDSGAGPIKAVVARILEMLDAGTHEAGHD